MYNTFCVVWLVHERGVIQHEPHPFYKRVKKWLSYNLRLYTSIIQHYDWADDESRLGQKTIIKKKKTIPATKSCTFAIG